MPLYLVGLLVLVAGAALAAPQRPAGKPPRGQPAPHRHPPHPPANASAIVIRGVSLIDGTGRPPQPNSVIVVRGNRIAAVGRVGQVPVPRGAWTLDAAGLTALPGLIDMHTHTTVQPGLLGYWLALGVTSVRDLGCADDECAELCRCRQEIQTGKMPGPRLFVSGPPLDGDPPAATAFPAPRIRSEEEAVREVARLAELGVDLVKIYRRLPTKIAKAAIDEAHRRQLPVTWDYQQNFSYALNAVLTGVDGLEHVYYSERSSHAENEQLAQIIANHKVWFDPTLVAFRPHEAAVTDDPDYRQLPRHLLDFWRSLFWPMETQLEFDTMQVFVRKVNQFGGRLLAGTDSPVKYSAPGFSLHRELALLVECKLTPMQAIQAATRNAAQALRREKELGTLEQGKLADLILVAGDPSRDITMTRRLKWVMQDGRLHEAAALLAQAKRLAAEANQGNARPRTERACAYERPAP